MTQRLKAPQVPPIAWRSASLLALSVLLLFALLTSCAPSADNGAPAPGSTSRDEGAVATPTGAVPTMTEEEVAVITTNLGTMVFRFFPEVAPKTVAHVKQLIDQGFFDGKSFYRVVAGHVIQGGAGFDAEDGPTVVGEFGAYPHVVGAVGLARDSDPDSGSGEIYICLAPRPHLDGRYAIFGLLVEGFDVLQAIGEVAVVERWEGDVAFHEPVEPVVIESLRLARRRLPAVPPPAESSRESVPEDATPQS